MKDKSLADAELVQEISVLKQGSNKPDISESNPRPAEDETDQNREEPLRMAREMAVIAEIGRVVGSTLDIGEVFKLITRQTKKLIPFDRFSVVLTNPDGVTFTVAYVSGFDLAMRIQGDTFPMAGTVSEIVLRSRKGLFLNTANAEELTSRFPHLKTGVTLHAGIHSLISVPLISRNEVIGVLHFQSKTANAYIERDLHLAERVGEQIAGAIANAQLFANLKKTEMEEYRSWKTAERLAEEMAVVAEIGRVIGSSLDINKVYERFAAEVGKLIPFDRIHVALIDPDERHSTIVYVSGLDIAERRPGDKYTMAGSISEAVARTRTGLLFNPASEAEIHERFPGAINTLTFSAGMRSIMCIPLISSGEVIGTLHFRSMKPDAYNEQHFRLAEKIGTQISGAIANAQLFTNLKKAETEQHRCRETAERLAEEMAVIAEIGKVIGSSLDINEVYERFAAEVKKLIPFDRIGVNPINPHKDTITFAYISGIDIHAWQTGDVIPIAGTFSEIVMQTRTGLLINTTGEEDMARRFPSITNLAGIRWGIRSLITVPLISNDEVIAALHFRAIEPNAFNERHLRLAEKIGTQISGAIANAQLFSELKDTEETLRRSEQLLQSYLDGAGDAIYVMCTDTGRILNCNMRACLDLGYSRDELLMLSAKDIETGHSSDQIDAFHSDVKRAGVKTFEGTHKRKDGSVFPVEIRLSLISPAQSERMISVVRDITQRRQGEEELEGYRMNLEMMVNERTAELEIKNTTLQELNMTLRVLLKQREDDKQDVEERFVMNIQNLVLPFVEQMKKGHLGAGQQPCLDIIETHLHNIATPLLKNVRQFNLTPKELKVAALVRNGRTTKEIAEILGIAAGSIDIHRNNIRRKLGLNSRRTNLQSYLETLA